MSTTETDNATSGFLFAPPLMGPLMDWRPEYGSIDDEGETVDLGGGVHVYSSPNFTFNVNTLYVTTPDGVAVMDSQLLARHADWVLSDIRARTDQPVRYVSNSHHHPDHTLGNVTFAAAGAELVSSYLTARLIDRTAAADLLFLAGMYGEHVAETYAVPRTTFVGSRELWLGKTVVQLFEFADSTTVAGESVDMTFAWLPQSKVLHVGDALEPGSHAFFAEGASVPDWMVQLGHVRELVNELEPEVIVPGHGAPGDAGIIDAQERYLATVAGLVEEYSRGGETPIDDEARAKLRHDIVTTFPGYGNPILLDISLDMLQMVGPVAFLTGRPDPTTARRLPTFR